MAMKEAQGCPSGFYYAYFVPDFKGGNYKEYYCPSGFGWFVFGFLLGLVQDGWQRIRQEMAEREA